MTTRRSQSLSGTPSSTLLTDGDLHALGSHTQTSYSISVFESSGSCSVRCIAMCGAGGRGEDKAGNGGWVDWRDTTHASRCGFLGLRAEGKGGELERSWVGLSGQGGDIKFWTLELSRAGVLCIQTGGCLRLPISLLRY